MSSAFDDIVERRIREAQARGEFDELPGNGRPLALDDDALVPPEVRIANRVLKNAGFLPPEVEALRGLEADRDARPDARARRMLAVSLALERRGIRLAAPGIGEYRRKVLEKLAAAHPGKESVR